MKVGLFIYTYNQEDYISESVQSALDQDYDDLRVVISDDASCDRTVELIEKIVSRYTGQKEIVVNYNENNLGIIGHVNFCLDNFSRDLDVVIGQAGDDISEKNRVSTIVAKFAKEDVCMVYSNATKIDENGESLGEYFKMKEKELWINVTDFAVNGHTNVLGASLAFRTKIISKFGLLPKELLHEDQTLAFRSGLLKKIIFINKPLLSYRVHHNNFSIWGRDRSSITSLKEARKKQINNTIKTYRVWLDDLKLMIPEKCYFNSGQIKSLVEGHLLYNAFLLALLDKNVFERLVALASINPLKLLESGYFLKVIMVVFLPKAYIKAIR